MAKSKRSKKMKTSTKLILGLGAVALSAGAIVLYLRSKQPGLSTTGIGW